MSGEVAEERFLSRRGDEDQIGNVELILHILEFRTPPIHVPLKAVFGEKSKALGLRALRVSHSMPNVRATA